jgi:predicted phage terminase large subunit-like protein
LKSLKEQDRILLTKTLTNYEKIAAENSLFYFGKYILGFNEFDENVHQEWEFFLKGAKRLKFVLIPRDHFKSSFFTISYQTQQLCIDKAKRFLLTNAVYDNAQTFLTAIKGQIEKNPKLKWWGLEPGDSWSTEELTVNRQTIHKEPSISIAGIGSQLPSQHYDVIIWDDLVNEKNITSKDQADKVIDWWKDTLSLLEPGGLGIVLGTRWSYRDLYEYIIQNLAENFDIIIRKAIADDGKIYFEKRFSREYLEELRKLKGPYKFSLQYQNELTDPEDAVIKREWILKYNDLPSPIRKFMTIDPALSEDPTACYSVIMTCAVDADNNLYVVDYFHDRVDPKKLIDKIFEKFIEQKPVKIGIETVAFQKVLKFWMEDQMRERGIFLPLEEFTTSEKYKPSRILGLQPRFANKTIFIRPWMVDLEGELIDFKFPEPNQLYMDLIDALAYQLEIIFKPFRVEKKDIPYMSPAWYEEKFGNKPEESNIANPHVYK